MFKMHYQKYFFNFVPDYPNISLILSVLFIVLILFISVFTFSSIITSTFLKLSSKNLPTLKCIDHHNLESTSIIHLVHNSADQWNEFQLEFIEIIANEFPATKYQINLMIIDNRIIGSNNQTDRSIRNQTNDNYTTDDTNKNVSLKLIGNNIKKFLFILFHIHPRNQSSNGLVSDNQDQRSLHQILSKHRNIVVNRISYEDRFKTTQLFYTWPLLNEELKIFAVRVLQLWDFGGISFDLDRYDSYYGDDEKTSVVDNMYRQFEQLASGDIIVDNDGLDMASKLPCRAFFADILRNLNIHNQDVHLTAMDVIRKSMQLFCPKSANCKTNVV